STTSMSSMCRLIVEGSTVNKVVSGRVQSELSEPLEHLFSEAEWLDNCPLSEDPETAEHIERIKLDIEAIRTRMRGVTSGPQTLLGVDRALANRERDPVIDGRRILVADDEPRIRHVLRDVLRGRGAEVTVCSDGGEAIAEIERVARNEAPRFDLVLSDIKMPDRNGYEVFAASRKIMEEAPVILMTGFGYDPHHSIVRASQEGLEAVLFKPVQVEQLLEAVRKALGSRETSPS
ncbi:MAG: response regulator, partial [Planctomycetota bacterium]